MHKRHGLRPDSRLPLASATRGQWLVRPSMVPPRTRSYRLWVLVGDTVPLLYTNDPSGFAEDHREGEVVRASVVARTDTTGVDLIETDRRQNAAREATRPIFNFDSTRGETSARSFRSAWEDLKTQSESRSGKGLTWSGEGGTGVRGPSFHTVSAIRS